MLRSIYIIIGLLIGVLPSAFPLMANGNEASVYTIPFKKANGLMLLESELEGETGFFIFDTGADALLLNKTKQEGGKQVSFESLNGSFESSELFLESLTVGDYTINNIEAYSVNLSAIENIANHKILGIIGARILESEVLHIDNENKVIRLLNSYEPVIDADLKVIESSIQFKNGIPIVPLEIEGHTYQFGLDTGSSISLLNNDLITSEFLSRHSSDTISVLSGSEDVMESQLFTLPEIILSNLKIKQVSFGMASFKKINNQLGIQLDGILSIDQLPTKDIYIYPQSKRIYLIL
jgi:hypothetical protein